MAGKTVWILFSLFAVMGSSYSEEPQPSVKVDPIAVELGKAKETYQVGLGKAKAKLLAAIDAEDARISDDTKLKPEDKLKQLGQLVEERKAFDAGKSLPKSVGLKKAVDEYKATAKDLAKPYVDAFGEAANKYFALKTQAGKDSAAAVIMARDEFRKQETVMIPATKDTPKLDPKIVEKKKTLVTDIIDEDDWLFPRAKGSTISVNKDGHIVLKEAQTMYTKKKDYGAVEINLVVSASKGAQAYVVLGYGSNRQVTSPIEDDGKVILAGVQPKNFEAQTRGMGKKPFAYDEFFQVTARVKGAVGEIFLAGKLNSGVSYGGDQPPPGAIAIVVTKGAITIKSLEIK